MLAVCTTVYTYEHSIMTFIVQTVLLIFPHWATAYAGDNRYNSPRGLV